MRGAARPALAPPKRPVVGAALGKTGGGRTGLRREKAGEERSGSASPSLPRSRRRLAWDASGSLLFFLGVPRCTRPAVLFSRAAVSGAARGGERAGRRRALPEEEEEATAIAPRREEEEVAVACRGTATGVHDAAEPPPTAAAGSREAPTPTLLAAADDAAAAACCIL